MQSRIRGRDRRTLHLRSNRKHQLLEASENPPFISFTDIAHRHKWRLLQKSIGKEIHELDLGDGNRMIAHVMLADSADVDLN